MNLDIIKRLIKVNKEKHLEFIAKYQVAENYYKNKPDIVRETKKEDKSINPVRNADNKVPINFHGLLVNQKASYLFTAPPLFDLGQKESNKKLSKILGDKFTKICKDLCIFASNASTAWLHIWKDKKGTLKYAVVNPSQVIAIFDEGLDKELIGVVRTYQTTNDTGEDVIRYEYWDNEKCYFYEVEAKGKIEDLKEIIIDENRLSNEYVHGIKGVPFVPFFNNNINTSDLVNIKELIDTYCKVFNGFVNDLEDIQEVIFVLTNYGGQDLGTFLSDLKKYKTIQIDRYEGGDSSGVSTLNIDIPTEARKELLAITRKLIFEQGQGIDPDPVNFGNSSGVALKFLYALLELKAGLMETEFKLSFAQFIRIVCEIENITIKDDIILQTWTRTSVSNDLELAEIATKSKGLISNETIVERHPFVEDKEKELEKIKAEMLEDETNLPMFDIDKQSFTNKPVETTGSTQNTQNQEKE